MLNDLLMLCSVASVASPNATRPPAASPIAPAPAPVRPAPAPAPSRLAPVPAFLRPAPAPAPFRLAPAPAPLLAAAVDTGLEAGDGLTVTPGLPVSPNGSVIPAEFLNLPSSSSGSIDDVVLNEDAVRVSQEQLAASEEVPPGVQIELVPYDLPAPAPAPFSYLVPDAAPFGRLAPSRTGRRLLGTFTDVCRAWGICHRPGPAVPEPVPVGNFAQNTLDVYPRNLNLRYRALSPSSYTLFARGRGPLVEDILQTGLADSWLQATMMSTLQGGERIRIVDVYGDFRTFEMMFWVRNQIVIVTTDSQVLFQGDELWTNAARLDPDSGKRIAWPLLWTKAYAILASKAPELVEPAEPSANQIDPCTGRGWCDLDMGLAYRAVHAHTGRTGQYYAMQGDIIRKQRNSPVTDRPAFKKLYTGQVHLEMLQTISLQQLKNAPGYKGATKSVDVGAYQLQIVDKQERIFSVRQKTTDYTFLLSFSHVYSLTLNRDGDNLNVASPWGYTPTLNAQGKRGENSKDRFIRRIPLYVVEFVFNSLHHG